MTDIDYTGSRALREVLDELDADWHPFAMARAGDRVREELRSGRTRQRIGEDRSSPTSTAAVPGALRG